MKQLYTCMYGNGKQTSCYFKFLQTKFLQLVCMIYTYNYASIAVKGQSLTITSLPESLFGNSGGVHSVVEGSVIQLYCSVEPDNVTVSWTKDDVPVIIDVHHLRVRTSSNGTQNTSVLT